MNQNNTISIILLAAGMSRRMGAANKLLLPFGGSTILETTLQNLIKADIGDITVVLGHESNTVKSVIEKYPLSPAGIGMSSKLHICENFDYEKGMTSSIQTGIKQWTKDNRQWASGFMICLSDMPLITPDEYRFLSEKFEYYLKKDEKAIVQPVFQGQRGNPTLFSNYYTNAILELDYLEGCKPIVQSHKEHLYMVEMLTPSVLKDADTPEAYKKLL